MTQPLRPATIAVRAGQPPDLPGRPVVAPVHRTVIFEFESAAQFGEVMADSRRGYLYSRIRNPSVDELAGAAAQLEGAPAGVCYGSGMAAVNAALDLLAPPGAGVVATPRLYGETYAVLRARADTRFIDPAAGDALREAAGSASVIYTETISSGGVGVADLELLAGIARETGARLVVDNTYATPLGCRPLELGADLVVH